jgi:hypothetical protein
MRETFLVAGAFLILSMVSLTVNRIVGTSTGEMIKKEVRSVGYSLGQQLLMEVLSKDYDEFTVKLKTTSSVDSFTLSSRFGQLEVINKRDDVDDFHNYTIPGSATRYSGFVLNTRVVYADTANPRSETLNSGKSFFKRVTVSVRNPLYLNSGTPADTLWLSGLATYY